MKNDFKYCADSSKTLVELYQAMVDSKGADHANSKDSLAEMGAAVVAKHKANGTHITANSARAKISNSGKYVTPADTKSASQGGKTGETKSVVVSRIAEALGIDRDDIATFEKGNLAELLILAKSVNSLLVDLYHQEDESVIASDVDAVTSAEGAALDQAEIVGEFSQEETQQQINEVESATAALTAKELTE